MKTTRSPLRSSETRRRHGRLQRLAQPSSACSHPLHDRSHANDLWIAASAIHIGAPLLAHDGVFDNTPGLMLRR